jgi:hypothetical protein
MDEPPQDESRGARAGALAAIGVTIILVALGLWLAQALIAMVKTQNCAMSGRRDCLEIPSQ